MKFLIVICATTLILNTSVAMSSSCVDTDGDGLGLDEKGRCVVEPAVRECVDIDGDGAGWNGSAKCQMTLATA